LFYLLLLLLLLLLLFVVVVVVLVVVVEEVVDPAKQQYRACLYSVCRQPVYKTQPTQQLDTQFNKCAPLVGSRMCVF
jgi:hypothetical protein